MPHEPLHSTLEALGAVIAILIAVFLFQRRDSEYSGKFFLIAMGFLNMGILDGLHAVSKPGDEFVLLHSTAVFAGGLWFALTWIKGLASDEDANWKKALPWIVIAGSLLFGFIALFAGETLPVMVHEGEFTATAVAINFIGGVLFVAAGVRLVMDSHCSNKFSIYLLACVSTLFAVTGLNFSHSALWDVGWWLWHIERLLAYLVFFGFVVYEYNYAIVEAQKKLWESEEKFRQLADITEIIFFVTSSDGKQCIYMNSAYEKIWGRSRESAHKDFTSWISAIHPADRERVSQAWTNIVVTGKYDIEFRVVQPNGEIRWVHAQGGPVRDDQGEIYRFAGTAEDITGQKCLTELLEKSEETYRAITQAANDAIISIKGPDGVIALWNKKAEAMFEYAADEALGKNLHGLIVPERYRQNAHDGLRKFFATGEGDILGKTLEVSALCRDGSEFPVELSIAGMRTSNGWEAIATVRDITERKKAESELIYIKKILSLQSAISKCFLMIDDNEVYGEVLQLILMDTESKYGVFGYLNEMGDLIVPSMTRDIWVKCQVSNKNIVFPKDKWADSSWPRALREKRPNYTNEQSTKVPEGHIPMFRHISMPIVYQGESIGLIQIANKETDYNENNVSHLQRIADHIAPILNVRLQKQLVEKKLKSAERQLTLSEKLAGIGQLSAGVCHEILNPLNIISIQTQLLLRREAGNVDLVERLTKIRGEIGRIEKIVSLLMTFARKGTHELRLVQINAELETALSLIEKDFSLDNIKIVRDFRLPSPEIKIDTDEMRQVFMNLMNNARYEMHGGGTLTVKTRLEQIDGRDHVRICFSDTGSGIKKENLTKIFDPFFTTKPEGQGTGMGLSMAHSIIEKHGGALRAESEEGKGATFIIDLPLKQGD